MSTAKFFDLHAYGLGYLNRVREVTPKRGQPFLAVTFAALHGAAEAVQYTRFDCRVSGSEAQELVRRAMPHLEAERKVLVGFKLGDLYPETFTYTQGDRAGETGVALKARLLRLDWVKVDGTTVWTRPKPSEGEAPQAIA
jgi:hypothetical protein